MLAKAKTIDGEIVEGYYKIDLNHHTDGIYEHLLQQPKRYYDEPIVNHKIDPSTLEYKIGDKWYSMEELESSLDALEQHYADTSC